MSDNLIDKIKAEIIKSGFPLEVFCKRRLEAHKWGCEGPIYVAIEDRMQELDIRGQKQSNFDKDLTAFVNLHISCKKCVNNHWVFFRDSEVPISALAQTHFNDNLEVDVRPLSLPKRFRAKDTTKSQIYTMAFQGQKNQIYDAVNELLSSYTFFHQFYGKHRTKQKPQFNILDIDFLTILLDGRLFAADIDDKDEVSISEISHIIYYHHEVEWPHHKHFSIEVVTKPYFDQYLSLVDLDVKDMTNQIKQQLVGTSTRASRRRASATLQRAPDAHR